MTPATFEAYRAARDADPREARRLLGVLVIESAPMVERMARRLARGDYEDLRAVGLMALAVSFETFDPARGVFASHARRKINDAFDREVIKVRPQVVRKDEIWGRDMPQVVKRAEQAHLAKHGKLPTAEELGVDADELATWRSSMRFDSYEEVDEDGITCPGVIASAIQDTSHALGKRLRRAIGEMSSQEQRILLSRVIEGLDFEIIGTAEGLLRDTTTRIYKRAIEKLRVALA